MTSAAPGTALPPPPPPAPSRPRAGRGAWFAGGAIGLAIGVLATLGAVALLDDEGGNTMTVASEPPGATTSAPDDAGPAASPPAATDPLPDPTYTSLDPVVYPSDPAALRAVLDRFDFPAWWWLPDAIAPKADPLPTVRSIGAQDGLLDDGVTVGGTYERTSTWFLPTTDLAAVEAEVLASVPADTYDVEAARASRSVTEQSGKTEVTYLVYETDDQLNHLYIDIKHVGPPDTTAPNGIEVYLALSGQLERAPAAVPTGPTDERAFLAAAPVAGFMRWNNTEFRAGADPTFGGPIGSYSATVIAPPDEFDRSIEFLSNPDNFPGQLKLVQPGEFTLPTFWEQPMAWGDFLGGYSISKPSTGTSGDLYITLEFRLS